MTTEALKQARDVLHALCEALADGDTTSAEQIARGSGTSAIAALDAAIAQEAADREDAERWRAWKLVMLRDETIDVGEAYVRIKAVGNCPTSADFDTAIDAARAKEKSRG